MSWRLLALVSAGVILSSTTSLAADVSPAPAGPAGIDITTTSYRPEPVGHLGGTLQAGSAVAFPCGVIVYTAPCNSTLLVQGPAMWSLWGVTPDHRWFPQLTTAVPTLENGGVVVRPDDGMDVSIELIPGARWSDGQPITCQDVADTAGWMMDMAEAGQLWGWSTGGLEDITAVEGGLGTSCVAHFSRPYTGYLGLWAPLLPSHYIRSISIDEAATGLYPTTDVASGVYSGPYRPTTWIDGQEVGFVPNASFWETIRKADAPFEAVIEQHFDSPDALIAAFADGQVDVALELSQADLPKLASFPAAQVDAAPNGYEQQTWNREALVRDWGEVGASAILEALHYATDKQAIVDAALGGVVEPICTPISPLDWYYRDTGPCPAHDPARAESILDAAGFVKGADGIRTREGRRLEFLACTTKEGFLAQTRVDTLTLLATQLREIGIDLEVRVVPSDYLWGGWDDVAADTPCSATHGTFGVTEFGYAMVPVDPSVWYSAYHSSQDPSLGDHTGSNYARVDSPEVDQALETVVSTVDLAKIRDAMGRLQELYVDPVNAFPEIPFYPFVYVLLRSDRMHNVVNNTTVGGSTWNIADWWRSP